MTSTLQKNRQIGRMKLTNFVNLSSGEASLVLSWRNDERVRPLVGGNPKIISSKEHREFLQFLRNREDRSYFFLKVNDSPIGVICILGIDFYNRRCLWGDYANPETINSGSGMLLEYCSLHVAFEAFGMHCVRCETLESNRSALRLHEFFEFTQEGFLKDYFFDAQENRFRSAILMSTTKTSWISVKPKAEAILKGFLGSSNDERAT